MGEPLTGKQMKDALERWGCWCHMDAVGRLTKSIFDSETALNQAREEYIPIHFEICRQHGVNPFRLLRNPNEIYLDWERDIERMRSNRDEVSKFVDAIESRVRTLPERQQQILKLKYVEFKDLNAVSAKMGIPKSAVYAKHANAVNKLRMMFTPA